VVGKLIKGIDVANYQSDTYDVTGIDFVIVKATEGISYVNPKYASQVKRARDKSLVVGHYHFVNTNASADEQAAYFVKTATEKVGEFLVLDWESPISDAEKNEFIKKAKTLAPGIKVGLYCNKDYWKNRDKSNYPGDFLWIADPSSPAGKPDVKYAWTIHQYSSAGGTDRNVANFANRGAMAVWAGKPVAKPTPHYAAFPGTNFFKLGKKSALITAMGKRLVAEGYKGYKVGPGPEFTTADKAAYGWWQKKLGYKGKDADGIPGATSWNKLKVPQV
jgi:hypothetical protein